MDAFIAIDRRDIPSFDPAKLEALTPSLMRWSEDVWILDMGLSLSYWWARAREQNLEVTTLWRMILQRLYCGEGSGDRSGNGGGDGESGGGDKSPVVTYGAAVAAHPWRALLLLRHMREKALNGLTDYDSPLGRRMFLEISWRSWLRTAKEIVPHCQKAGHKRLGSFPRCVGQLRRAVKRLRIEQPMKLRSASAGSMRRRFGSLVGELWAWTWGGTLDDGNTTTASDQSPNWWGDGTAAGAGPGSGGKAKDRPGNGFPWQAYQFRAPPVIRRNLDFTIWQWDQMAPLLQEDFNRFCTMDKGLDEREHVLKVLWRLFPTTGPVIELELGFRNPHNLHRDAPTQRTALAQSLFRYSSLAGHQTVVIPIAGGKTTCDIPAPIGVVAWELTITEKIILPPVVRALFNDQGSDSQSLAALENLLPMPLRRYDLRRDWVPESSYGATGVSAEDKCGRGAAEEIRDLTFSALGEFRPLFIFEQPQPMGDNGVLTDRGMRGVFLERTMEKWWLPEPGSQSDAEQTSAYRSRDYFQIIDRDGRHLWVFQSSGAPGRDSHGGPVQRGKKRWYVHGVYA